MTTVSFSRQAPMAKMMKAGSPQITSGDSVNFYDSKS
jgi:hypothetical protein